LIRRRQPATAPGTTGIGNMTRSIQYVVRFLGFVLAFVAVLWFVEIDQVAKGTGRIVPEKEIWISALVEAQIAEVYVQEGQLVAAGDSLIAFKKDIAESRLTVAKRAYERSVAEREAARAALQAVEAPPPELELKGLNSELDGLKEKARLASRQLKMVQQLFDRGRLASAEDLEKARADSILAATQIEKSLSALELLKLGPITPLRKKAFFTFKARDAEVAEAEATYTVVRRELGNYTQLAPAQGRVLMVLSRAGAVPAVGDTLMLIGSEDPMLAECHVPAEFAPWIRPGQHVDLWPQWASSFEFSGRVHSVRRYVQRASYPSVRVLVKIDSVTPLIPGNRLVAEVKLRRASVLELILFPFDWSTAGESKPSTGR